MWIFVFEIGDKRFYHVRTYFPDLEYHMLEIHTWWGKNPQIKNMCE